MTPIEYRTVEKLGAAWKAEPRKMPSDWAVRWMFTRARALDPDEMVEGPSRAQAVAMCEVMETPKTWDALASEGVTVRPDLWKQARSLSGLSKLPLIVVVAAADGTRYAKVTDFGPDYLETQRLLTPAFRPV